MKFRSFSATVVVLGCCSACGGTLEEIRSENHRLNERVTQQQSQIVQITGDLEACRTHSNVLNSEKEFREVNLVRVRDITRAHIAGQFSQLNALARSDELLDYVGGELIQRGKYEDSKKRTILYAAPFPGNATIYKVRCLPAKNTTFSVGVFKRIQGGLVCVMITPPIIAEAGSGVVAFDLPSPLYIQAGDYVGYIFPEKVGIQFDERTGKFELYGGALGIGDRIDKSAEEKGLNYSLGVYGIVEQPGRP